MLFILLLNIKIFPLKFSIEYEVMIQTEQLKVFLCNILIITLKSDIDTGKYLRSRGTSSAEVEWLMSINSTAPKPGTHILFLSMVEFYTKKIFCPQPGWSREWKSLDPLYREVQRKGEEKDYSCIKCFVIRAHTCLHRQVSESDMYL